MASSRLAILMMGRMGPKISLFITGEVRDTSTRTVGAINLSAFYIGRLSETTTTKENKYLVNIAANNDRARRK